MNKRLTLAIAIWCSSTVACLALALRSAEWGVTLLVAILGVSAACLVVLSGVNAGFRAVQSQFTDDVYSLARLLAAEQHSLLNITPLLPVVVMPVSTFSMRAANLEALADLLRRNQPRIVIELGSGLSTLLVANWFRREKREGRVVAFEHDVEWAEKCRYYLRANDLEEVAEIRTAPLKLHTAFGHQVPWYDLGSILGEVDSIDLLIVDGPPAGSADLQWARFPALDAFYLRLSPEARVFLDDTSRDGERRVVEQWVATYPEFRPWFARTLSGYCILERGSIPDAGPRDESLTTAPTLTKPRDVIAGFGRSAT